MILPESEVHERALNLIEGPFEVVYEEDHDVRGRRESRGLRLRVGLEPRIRMREKKHRERQTQAELQIRALLHESRSRNHYGWYTPIRRDIVTRSVLKLRGRSCSMGTF